MLIVRFRNGLNNTIRAALAHERPAFQPTSTARCRTLNSTSTRAEAQDDSSKSSSKSFGFFDDSGFQGFSGLEPNEGHHARASDAVEHEETPQATDDGLAVQNYTGHASGSAKDNIWSYSVVRGLEQDAGHEGRTFSALGPGNVDKSTYRARMRRRLVQPKRFKALVKEARVSGMQSPYIADTRTGNPHRLMTRTAISTKVLEDEVIWMARNTPIPRKIATVLTQLIEERKVRPRPDHYESVILAQCHSEFGSIENVKAVLEQMQTNGFTIEANIWLAVLTVLSVHPDTFFRAKALQVLEGSEDISSINYRHLNILSLIREGQLELATMEIERHQTPDFKYPIPNWLWTVYLHALCDLRGDFDAVLQLLYKLHDSNFLFPRPTLLHLLTRGSDAGNVHVTKFIWRNFVEDMHIIPNEAISLAVLRIAVRERDKKLAESVAVVLESVAGNKHTEPPSHEDDPEDANARLPFDLVADTPEVIEAEKAQLKILAKMPPPVLASKRTFRIDQQTGGSLFVQAREATRANEEVLWWESGLGDEGINTFKPMQPQAPEILDPTLENDDLHRASDLQTGSSGAVMASSTSQPSVETAIADEMSAVDDTLPAAMALPIEASLWGLDDTTFRPPESVTGLPSAATTQSSEEAPSLSEVSTTSNTLGTDQAPPEDQIRTTYTSFQGLPNTPVSSNASPSASNATTPNPPPAAYLRYDQVSPYFTSTDTILVNFFSTPPSFPSDITHLRPRRLPQEALDMLAELGIRSFTIEAQEGRINAKRRGGDEGRESRGVIYDHFRCEGGLAGARVDERRALMEIEKVLGR
jgi:hypothetical protein